MGKECFRARKRKEKRLFAGTRFRHCKGPSGSTFSRRLAMSRQMTEDEQPMPAKLKVRTSLRILNSFRIMAAIDGVGAKQLQDVITASIC